MQGKFVSVKTNTNKKYSKNQVFILNYLINEILSRIKIFYNEVEIVSDLNGYIRKGGWKKVRRGLGKDFLAVH